MASPNIDEDTMESHLNDLLGGAPEPEPEENVEPDKAEAKAKAKAKDETETEAEAEAESEAESETEKTDQVDPDDDADAEEPSETGKTQSGDTLEDRLAEAERREAGLAKEIKKLRDERRQHALEASRYQAPAPTRQDTRQDTPTTKITQTTADGQIPVIVSEDGQSVYVDKDALRREYESMNRPTPEQVFAMETQRLAQDFISSNPDRNQPIFDVAQKADEYISLALGSAMNQHGYQPRSIEDAQGFIRHVGIDKQVEEYFPEIAPHLDEFVASYASKNAIWKRKVLDRIALDAAPSDSESEIAEPSKVESVANNPQSLARKGGTRSQSASADEAEFDKLEAEFRKDPAFMPDKRYKRYQALGKKLGRSGL